ncbi:MAG TPA: pseudaminic acid synthase [Lentisphaeria bacterium]|nr:MAG: pseudaminic acid synthase [Lentisphaerae bacterium GWF2_49_21]HBC87163.1 pseudaminic acid synthase [Lentisphaeria bacterium]
MSCCIKIGRRVIGSGHPAYIIAEISANHGHKFEKAVEIIGAAKDAGADAVKLQTYTPDTITIDCDNEYFMIKGTIWKGKNLYKLYGEAYTPWEWQPKLKKIADKLKIDLFSTPFDPASVDFLRKMNVPAFKVASFELVDIPLIRKIARAGKPVIMSTGMATMPEICDAVKAARAEGNNQLALLKCTSEYPADPNDMNLRTIPDMKRKFGTVVGLSDHTLGIAASVAAVTLGANIIEKHVTLSRKEPGPDSSFSLEPSELEELVKEIRTAESALGKVSYTFTSKEKATRIFRRSLFVIKDIGKGEPFTGENVRSIRPGHGLPPKYFDMVIGRKASCSISRGTPLSRKMIG